MEKFAGYGFNKCMPPPTRCSRTTRLAQGALHGRVLRRQHDGGDRQHRQAQGAARRRASSFGVDVRAARRQPRHLPLRAGRRQASCATAWARSRARARARSRRSSRRATRAGRSRSLFDFCARVDRSASTSACRGADQGRRLRRAARRPRDRCWPASACAFDWADTPGGATPTRAACSTSATRTRREHAGAGAGGGATPWSIKERLTLEKTALGFYLSGHLFDQSAAEVRRFAKRAHRRPDRQPRAAAARRHRRATCASSTASAAASRSSSSTTRASAIEAVANEELLDANRDLLKDDELRDRAGQACSPTASPAACASTCSRSGTWPRRAAASASTCASSVNGSVPPVAERAARLPGAPRRRASRASMVQGLRGAPRTAARAARAASSTSAKPAASTRATRRWRAGLRSVRTAARASVVYESDPTAEGRRAATDGCIRRRAAPRSDAELCTAGLVLTGGGARAAYQVGVLKALAQHPARMRRRGAATRSRSSPAPRPARSTPPRWPARPTISTGPSPSLVERLGELPRRAGLPRRLVRRDPHRRALADDARRSAG